MTRENDTPTPDPLELLPLGRAETHEIRVRETWNKINRFREAVAMPEGPDRERLVTQIRNSLDGGEPVKFGSVGRGTGERHTRQSNLGSEKIL